MRGKKFRDGEYLEHIAERIARIERATSGVDLAGFLGNQDLQAAIERYVEVIGEAAGKLSQQTRDLAPDVPWGQVIGARNIIVHGYAEIEPGRIWDIVKDDMPSLHVAVDRLKQLITERQSAESQKPALARGERGHSEDGNR